MESFSEGGKRWLAAASIKMSRNVKAHILHHISLGTQNPACHGNINKITPSHEVIEAMWSNIPQLWQWHDIGIDFVPDFSICFWRVRVCQCAPRRQCRGPSCWGWCPPEHGKSQCCDILWSFYFHPNLGHQRLITERPRPGSQCFLCHLWIDKRWDELQREKGLR